MRKNYQPFVSITLLAFLFTAAGCDSAGISDRTEGPSTDPVHDTAAKWQDDFGSVSLFDDDGAEWTVTYDGRTYDGANTTFAYVIETGGGVSGDHFALQDPTCAVWNPDKGGGSNDNSNGDIEWNLNGTPSTVSYSYFGNVPEGVVEAGFKFNGDGNTPTPAGNILGPCQGIYTISGAVFLNEPLDKSDPGSYNTTWEEGIEPGVSGAQVELIDGPTSMGFATTTPDGRFSFEVLGPPIYAAPDYSLTVTEASNPALFVANVTETVTSMDQDVSLTSPAGYHFGFEINLLSAKTAFETGAVGSSGLPRPYWRVQATGKGSPKWQPDITVAEFDYLLNCGGSEVGTCVANLEFVKNDPDFHLLYDLTLSEARGILKSASKNDDREYLRTALFVSILNYASGLGMLEGVATFNEAGTRLIIESALTVLHSTDAAGKVPDGSVEESGDLLNEMNGD